MSKAYNSVHIPLLKKALVRIKIPDTIINLIENILITRQNTVITTFRNTEAYKVQDGIDQGETITPLLWRIYYDPLLTRINETYTAYTMSAPESTNTTDACITQNYNILAYMDDTL